MNYVRLTFLFLILAGCQRAQNFHLDIGECVVGDQMSIWKLIRKDDGQYLLSRVPIEEGAPLELVNDLTTFKKIECP